MDKEGPFEVQRRYKEFNLLRGVLVQRFLGLYVPPISLFLQIVILGIGGVVLLSRLPIMVSVNFAFLHEDPLPRTVPSQGIESKVFGKPNPLYFATTAV